MMRATRILVASAAIILAVAGAPAAARADDSADLAPGTAVYDVEVVDTSVGPDGAGTPKTSSGELVIACVGSACAVVEAPGPGVLRDLALATGATMHAESAAEATGGACTGGRGSRAISVTATATTVAADVDQQPIEWEDCPDGTQAYGHARTVTWRGALVAADPCVFTATGCLAAASASRLASGDPAAPSVLSALVTPAEAGTAPGQLALAALLTIILVLLVAFPTSLLDSAVDAGTERWTAWRARRAGPGDPSTPGEAAPDKAAPDEAAIAAADAGRPRGLRLRGWAWAAAGVAAAGVISGFVDPQFGLNPGSGRMLLSLVVSLGIDVVLGWAIVIWVVRRSVPGARAEFAFRPMTLLIVIGAVVFTRLTGFEPGIVFGLVAGVAFAVLADRVRAEAKVVLIGLACAFGFAVVAWALYGLFGGPASGESFWGTLLQETLASTAIAGMAALPIALVPLRGLAGHAVWAWNRWVWVACYAIALVAFFIVLMPMPFSWQGVHLDLLSWVVLYLAYAAAAVIAWLVLARPWRKEADAEAVGPDPVAAGVGAGSGEVPAGRLEE